MIGKCFMLIDMVLEICQQRKKCIYSRSKEKFEANIFRLLGYNYKTCLYADVFISVFYSWFLIT